jgi:paraquat-inducible protein A
MDRRRVGTRAWTGLAFLAALGLWGAGVSLPVLTVTQFFVFEDAFSLLGAAATLFAEGEFLIGLIVAVFTLILPPAKLILGFSVWRWADAEGRVAGRAVALLEAIGRWAMMDVLILAIVVVTLKSSWLADVSTAPGLYCFAASSVLAMIAGLLLKRSVG